MRFLLIAVILFFTFSNVKAQNSDLQKNPKSGKCYERYFYSDKLLEWEEINEFLDKKMIDTHYKHFNFKKKQEPKAKRRNRK